MMVTSKKLVDKIVIVVSVRIGIMIAFMKLFFIEAREKQT